MNHQGKRGWKQAMFFARMRRIYIWGLTALTKEPKPVSRKNAIGKQLLYNILYFLVDKRIKYICTQFCQHLAPDFKGNGKSGYVCQHINFIWSRWYHVLYALSTLSTVKYVHIIFWKCTKDKSVIWGFIRWNNTMEGVSVRWYLENTGIQTFLPHGNGLLFAKNDSLL